MKPPKKLSEFLSEKIPHISLSDAKEVIMTYNDYKHSVRGRYCDICGKEISEEERNRLSEFDFNYCCTEHLEYRRHFQLQLVRQQLGIEKEELFDL